MTLSALLWTVKKLKDGGKAGKWVIRGVNGDSGWFYNTEQSAERDCRLLNLSEALPATGGEMYRLRSIQLDAEVLGHRRDRALLVEALRSARNELAKRLLTETIVNELDALLRELGEDM